MSLISLNISNLRLFEDVHLTFSPKLNLIYGDNASGKTTLLEAIHLLTTARSFRSRIFTDILRYGQNELTVTGKVQSEAEKAVPIGLQRSSASTTMRAEGKALNKVSDLAKWLPLQILHPDSHQLISGGPKIRRRFLDWGVFHVEHQFLDVWKRYDKILKQRNACLREKRFSGMESAWNQEIDKSAEQLHIIRTAYVKELTEIIPLFTHVLAGDYDFSFEYQPGWDTEQPLSVQLLASLERDKRRGFTHYGPHRAELVFKLNEHKAQSHVSRGQQKLLVYILLLAQTELFTQRTGKHCAVLLDDLPAELDSLHRSRLLSVLEKMAVQVFITCTEKELVDVASWPEKKMFHVEQGQVTEML